MGAVEIVKFLVSRGANVNAKTDEGETPLDMAIVMAKAHPEAPDHAHRAVVDYLSGLK